MAVAVKSPRIAVTSFIFGKLRITALTVLLKRTERDVEASRQQS